MRRDIIMLIKLFVIALMILLSAGASYANDNPLFVTITTDTCYSCKKLKPVIEELEYEYSGKVNFITLNISSKSQIEEARQIAQWQGITTFFEENKNAVPKVGILCPGGNKVEKILTGETRKEVYQKELDYILFDTKTICSL